MSTLSGVGGATAAWPSASERASQFKAKVFAKIDANGDGSIDKSEMQSMLDKLSGGAGQTTAKADDVFSAIDSDGDGKISASELDAGVKSLLAPPTSTVDFAGRCGGGGSSGSGGGDLFSKVDGDGSGSLDASELQTMLDKFRSQHADATSSPDGSSTPTGADLLKKLDTDGDGKVSEAEFKAGRPHGGGHQGPPPPASVTASSGSSGSGSDPSSSDGTTTTARERAAADLKALLASLAASFDSNATQSAASASTSLSLLA